MALARQRVGPTMERMSDIQFEEIGYWSEIKLDIVKQYAQAYTTILAKQAGFRFFYIDGFAGAGVNLSKVGGDLIPGSPLNALAVDPPFHKYFLIDLAGDKVEHLRSHPKVRDREDVHVIHGDCNEVLLADVFPTVKWEDYRRALCVLGPYGLHLDWRVLAAAGEMRSIDIFLNFPIMDMNRNALWHKPGAVSVEARSRMTAFWGDESWRKVAYAAQRTLFGDDDLIKLDNEAIVDAFQKRLRTVAGFTHVPDPMPMRNSKNAVIYYLFFASAKPVAGRIVEDIFAKHRGRSGS